MCLRVYHARDQDCTHAASHQHALLTCLCCPVLAATLAVQLERWSSASLSSAWADRALWRMQEILGECSLLAVSQSIPLTPMQFARLYEDTQDAVRALDSNALDRRLSSAKARLSDPPQCSALLDAIDPAQSYFIRELEKILGPEQTQSAASNGTADFVDEVRRSGSKTTTVAALAGMPVQYTACANDTWDNRLIYTYTDHNSAVGGGQQYTWVAFSNKCPTYDARVTIDIVPLPEGAGLVMRFATRCDQGMACHACQGHRGGAVPHSQN